MTRVAEVIFTHVDIPASANDEVGPDFDTEIFLGLVTRFTVMEGALDLRLLA